MAILKGKDGVVKVAASGGSPTDEPLHIQSWNIDETAETVRPWSMGDTAKAAFATVTEWSGSVTCYIDPTDAAAALLLIGDAVELELYPGGAATDAPYYSGAAVISGVPKEGAKDGIPTVTINFEGNGALTKSTVTL